MKHLLYFLTALAGAVCLFSCNVSIKPSDPGDQDDPISIASPKPSEFITKVSLTEEQKSYVSAGNSFAFKCLDNLYEQEAGNLIYSPLSLQYALAMAVNGASGDTAAEITRALGYGTDLKALNEYCNILLNQLPALDEGVELSLADVMMVQEPFRVCESFRKTLNDTYYAPIEYFNPANVKDIVSRINKWASLNTRGLIYPFVSENDISSDFVAAIMNALYFKAPWEQYGNPLFLPELTEKQQPFYLEGGQVSVDLMQTTAYLPYASKEGYDIVSIPYSSGKFCMYVLLPKLKGKEDSLNDLLGKLLSEDWNSVCASMNNETLVHLRLPKFSSENKYQLVEIMKKLGINQAFTDSAQFDSMFDSAESAFYIGNILQMAKISVEEWGTEAAAVTAVMVETNSSGERPQVVDFCVDHPFVYIIGEKSSGAILFMGCFRKPA